MTRRLCMLPILSNQQNVMPAGEISNLTIEELSKDKIYYFFQVIANYLIPDHEADAFVSPKDPLLPYSWGDSTVEFLFSGLMRWDAQYFIHIAEYGYTHENTLVFFPLFPLLVRGIGTVIYLPLQAICNYHSCLVIGAVFLNFYLFIKTSLIVFQLSKEILRNEVLAYRSALLFCISPASIFFTAPYSECLYCFLMFSALLAFENKKSLDLYGRFGLASFVRSNGLVNVGFLLYNRLQDCASYFYKLRSDTTDSGKFSLIVIVILAFNYTLIPLVLGCGIIFLPFIMFQVWCHSVYCQEENTVVSLPSHLELYLRANFLHSPDLGAAEWCYNMPPLAYSHIQEKYWEVGMFKYYEMKQIPNFILALPIVMTIICHAALYMVDNPQVCLGFGIMPQSSVSPERTVSKWCKEGINSWRVFVYTIHSLALCIFCVLCIHVQVTTRLLCSSSPIVYWFPAHLITHGTRPPSTDGADQSSMPVPQHSSPGIEGKVEVAKCGRLQSFFVSEFPNNFWSHLVLSYFIFYFILGTILFANFLPWT